MTSCFRNKLRNRELLTGTILTLPSPELSEILSLSGFDWMFIDLEHSSLTIRDAQMMLQAGAPETAGVVRVPANREEWVKKCLDIGAAGIMIPQVKTPQAARKAVSLSKYPPQGIRSVGIARAHGYGRFFKDYVARANDTVAVIVQIEHEEGVANIEAILDIPGIDAVFVGPYDLSASMGKPGQIDDPDVKAAIGHVMDNAVKKNIPLGIFGATPSDVGPWIKQGFTLIAVGMDTMLFSNAAGEIIRSLKEDRAG